MIKFLKKENIKNNKALTIFSVFFVLVFIFLGFWQIERASEKLNLVENFEIQQSSQPQYISENSVKWSRVFIEGVYDSSKQVLIDNQIFNGRVGYKIYTPFYFGKINRSLLTEVGFLKVSLGVNIQILISSLINFA